MHSWGSIAATRTTRPVLIAIGILWAGVLAAPGRLALASAAMAVGGGRVFPLPTEMLSTGDPSPVRAPSEGAATTAGGETPPREQPAVTVRRHREADDLRRQDVAAELAGLGLALKWQEHTLGDLIDWRDRIQATNALRSQSGVLLDWRQLSLAELTDLRLRAAKASEMASLYGVHVDWQRYSWVALESLRRDLANLPGRKARGRSEGVADGVAEDDTLIAPGLSRRRDHQLFGTRDPDSLIAPTFAFDTPLVWSRRVRHHGGLEADALLVPTFVAMPPLQREEIIEPWNRPGGDRPPSSPANDSARERRIGPRGR